MYTQPTSTTPHTSIALLITLGPSLGSPGIVYIQGSGNDLWTGRSYQDTAEGMRAVIKKLRELYPTSLIMLSEVVGRRISEQTNRHQLSEHLAAMGRQENVNVVPTRYWITDKGVAHLLADSVHLSSTGHTAFAPHLAAWIAGPTAPASPMCSPQKPSSLK